MSTLIVLLPPRDPSVTSEQWQLPDLPFVLLDKHGHQQRVGSAPPALLPKASTAVLIIAARDVLMVKASLPPVKGQRLRQVLPNAIEDQLIQDPQICHLAVDPMPTDDGKQVVAAIDRSWFRFIHQTFTSAGHRALRAVPITRCLPSSALLPETAAAAQTVSRSKDTDTSADAHMDAVAVPICIEPLTALLLGPVVSIASAWPAEQKEPAAAPLIELAIACGVLGEGLAVPADRLCTTLAALAGDASLTVYRLTDLPQDSRTAALARRADADSTSVRQGGATPPAQQCESPISDQTSPAGALLADNALAAEALSFSDLTQRAAKVRFDLCQFEFSPQPWRIGRNTLKQWRLPITLAAATLVVTIVSANVQWFLLARQRDAMVAQQTELLLTAFPNITAVLDPPAQMARELQRLRHASGELSPGDFLVLIDGVSRALAPVPVNAIAALDYHDRTLELTFKPGASIDADFAARLAQHGLDGRINHSGGSAKWIIRSK